MNTSWTVANTQFELHRYPPNQHDKSLQAWDSSDDLVVQHVLDTYQHTLPLPDILVYDDLFGAISLALNNFPLSCVVDSYVSKMAIEYNHEHNSKVSPTVYNSLEKPPTATIIVVKLTKNLAYLEHQLQAINQYQENCDIIATGKTTLVTTSVMKLFERYFDDVSSSLAKKKSRLIFAKKQHKKLVDDTNLFHPKFEAKWPEQNLVLRSHANVFSKDQIDIGGRFLADHLPLLTKQDNNFTVIDLGCGNGLLGLCYLQQNKERIKELITDEVSPQNLDFKMIFADESHMAINSVQQNVEINANELINVCNFSQDDCLSQQPDNSADLILCNPPFHQQNTITTHITEQMIKQSAMVLKSNGVILLVANKHLAYQKMLKDTFGGFTVLSSNSKFVIYMCQHKNVNKG